MGELYKKCLGYDKQIENIKHKGREKVFCSDGCRAKFNSKKRYLIQRESADFKSKRKAYFNIWRVKNREHFNSLVRERNKLHNRKVREERHNKGLCMKCGKARTDKFVTCPDCRAKIKMWTARRKLNEN